MSLVEVACSFNAEDTNMSSTKTGSDISKNNSLSTSIAIPSCGGRENIWIDGVDVANKTAHDGSDHVGSAQSSRRSGIH